MLAFPAALGPDATTALRGAGFRFNKLLQHTSGPAGVWGRVRTRPLTARPCSKPTIGNGAIHRHRRRSRRFFNLAGPMSAPEGRTYGRKRSDQSTAKTPCEEGAVL